MGGFLALGLLSTSCAVEDVRDPESPLAPDETAAEYATPDAPPQERGKLVEAAQFADLDAGLAGRVADAQRLTYTSTSGLDGSETEVTGAVFVPLGPVPDGGWPVVSYAHGTTGVAAHCGPSQYPDMLGEAARISSLLDAGFAVVATDYEGLGAGGPHPYLEPATAAYNVIDAVRAAREANASISERWAAVGTSQGGQAVWAASEQAAQYGGELDFLGSVALAPAADLTPIAEPDPPWQLDPFQLGLLPYVLAGFQVADPTVDFDDYLRGVLAGGFGTLDACSGENWLNSAVALLQSQPGDIGPFTEEATEDIREWLDEIALPRQESAGPLLVIYGDQDTVVPPDWTARAVRNACSYGTDVAEIVVPGADHFNLNGTQLLLDWLDARVRGEAPITSC